MKKAVVVVVLVAGAALLAWLAVGRNRAREAPFTRVARAELVSVLTTNGKAEPLIWRSVRAGGGGVVEDVLVKLGEEVKQGAVLARLDARRQEAALGEAEARVAAATAELRAAEQGARPAERAELENGLAAAREQLGAAEREAEALARLVAKQAATPAELERARDLVRQWRQNVAGFEKKLGALINAVAVDAARARLREAEAALRQARTALAECQIRAPIPGTIYELPVRAGSYVQPGDEVARVGELLQMRVTVYVDEPELGRLSRNQPVTLTWDAKPGSQWQGRLESAPTQVAPLGSRQVGQALCLIENPSRDLLPGVNLNVSIRTATAPGALVVPRSALVRRGEQTGVWLLAGDRVRWQAVALGIFSVTQAQVTQGLKEGDAVALPADPPLAEGVRVRARFQ